MEYRVIKNGLWPQGEPPEWINHEDWVALKKLWAEQTDTILSDIAKEKDFSTDQEAIDYLDKLSEQEV